MISIEKDTYSVRIILLPSDTCSTPRWLMPLPFVFLPDKVSPLPLKLSQWSPPLLTVGAPPVTNPPARDDDGREEPGDDEFKSMFNLEAIVDGGRALGRSGSTYPTGGAKSTSRSVSRTHIPAPPGTVSITKKPKTMEL